MPRLRALVCAVGLGALCATGQALAAEPGAHSGPGGARESETLTYFTAEEIAEGGRRARESRLLRLASLAWSVLVLVTLSHPRIGARFVAAAGRVVRSGEAAPAWRTYAAALLTVAMMAGAYFILRKPFAWARGYWFEHRWDLSTQGGFLRDWVRAALIATVFHAVALGAVVILRAQIPRWWPVAAWGAVATLIVVMVFLYPVVVDPVFNTFTPVEDGGLRERAERVARRAGIDVGEVLGVDASRRTRRTNAYFTGLGATKRIVLYDTLRDGDGPIPAGKLDKLDEVKLDEVKLDEVKLDEVKLDEVETILAHEAGHWMHGHVWKGTLLALAGVAGFFVLLWLLTKSGWSWMPDRALPGGARAASVVLLLATVVNFLSMPVQNAISRSMEREADRASLELTGNPEAFIRAEVELARRNLSDIEPGRLAVFWLYTHPPVMERIRMAEKRLRHR